MEPVEASGATVAEAINAAVESLGVAHDQLEVEVVQEPKRGLFSGGKKAIIRAKVREVPEGVESNGTADDSSAPSVQHDDMSEPKQEENEMTDVTTEATEPVDIHLLDPQERMRLFDEECELAADFMEGLLDLLDLPGDLEIEVGDEGAVVNVSEVGSGLLIGRRGATLDALQELVRSTTQRQTERRSYVRIDVEGYRARQLEKLSAKCRDAIAQVREAGEPYRLEPMDSYERKMMHDLVGRSGGVVSSSEGAEPKRRVVIHPE